VHRAGKNADAATGGAGLGYGRYGQQKQKRRLGRAQGQDGASRLGVGAKEKTVEPLLSKPSPPAAPLHAPWTSNTKAGMLRALVDHTNKPALVDYPNKPELFLPAWLEDQGAFFEDPGAPRIIEMPSALCEVRKILGQEAKTVVKGLVLAPFTMGLSWPISLAMW
jgi:hypothetical protein